MNTAAVRILLVEDSPSDAALLQESLRDSGYGRFEFTHVESLAEGLDCLRRHSFDVLLLDLSLPDSTGPDTFLRARNTAPQVPIVVLTGLEDETVGLEAVRHGIQDYLVKGQSSGRHIARSIRYAIERKQTEEALKFLMQCGTTGSGEGFFEELARYLARTLNMDFVCIDRLEAGSLAARTLAVFHNGRFEDNISYTLKDTPCGDVVGQRICCFPRNVRGLFPKDAVLQDLQAESYVGTTLWNSQGQPIGLIALIGRQPLADTGLAESILLLVAVRAAGELERQQAEEALRKLNEELEQRVAERTAEVRAASLYARNLIETSLDPLVTISRDGKITDVNHATELATGVPRERLIGSNFSDYFTEPDKANAGYQKVIAEGLVRDYPLTIRHAAGHTMHVLYNAAVYRNEAGEVQGVFAAARDITERKRMEDAHSDLQRRLVVAEETERGRISRELHDRLGQDLTALKLGLQ
jgi:PAS domain S-box-containing protein